MTPLFVGTSILGCSLLPLLLRVIRLGRQKKSLLRESLIGEIGQAQMSLAPTGFVTVRCQTYPARGTAPIAAGDRVCVIGTGNILTVEPYCR
jgi:membrane-bound ClpP family serine protease